MAPRKKIVKTGYLLNKVPIHSTNQHMPDEIMLRDFSAIIKIYSETNCNRTTHLVNKETNRVFTL